MAEREVVIRPLGEPGDLGWVVMKHGEIYAEELSFDASFEAFVARVVADYHDGREGGPQAAWIAEADGVRAGSIFCVPADDRTAKLRLLIVDPVARGLGLGGRMVERCLQFRAVLGAGGRRPRLPGTGGRLPPCRRPRCQRPRRSCSGPPGH